MTRLLPVLVAATLVMLAAAGVGAGAEWDVYPGAGTPIQDATCGAGEGDTIYVHGGTYDESRFEVFSMNSPLLWSYELKFPNEKCIAISDDGDYIVVGTGYGSPNDVYLFSKNSSKPLWKYPVEGNIWSVAISSDGNYTAVGSRYTIYLFNKSNGIPLWNYSTDYNIYSVAISGDGNYIVAAEGGGRSR